MMGLYIFNDRADSDEQRGSQGRLPHLAPGPLDDALPTVAGTPGSTLKITPPNPSFRSL
jgi:hypothetical protein